MSVPYFVSLIVVINLLLLPSMAFVLQNQALIRTKTIISQNILMACRRDTKEEKRRRNYLNALKYRKSKEQSNKAINRLSSRARVASSEEEYMSKVFQLTTDEDDAPLELKQADPTPNPQQTQNNQKTKGKNAS